MESSWGRNVSDYGLAWTGATVCSRWLADPSVILTNEALPNPNLAREWQILTDVSFPYVTAALGKVPGHPHFPYGYDVEPNVPL